MKPFYPQMLALALAVAAPAGAPAAETNKPGKNHKAGTDLAWDPPPGPNP